MARLCVFNGQSFGHRRTILLEILDIISLYFIDCDDIFGFLAVEIEGIELQKLGFVVRLFPQWWCLLWPVVADAGYRSLLW